ncbi:MAG TPA: tetratricopeptide repeat protein [Turneriella sp.]|nr:tetratricopeptide repeat protein [Turneriella sp.]
MKFIALILLPLLFATLLFAKRRELLLGEKAYSHGAYDTARKHFEAAIENGEASGDPHLYIGLILESRRQYAESIPYFRAAAERPMTKKFKKVAYWKMVILCRKAKQYAEALRYVERLESMGEKSELFEKIRAEADGHSITSPEDRSLKGFATIQKATNLEEDLRKESGQGQDETKIQNLRKEIIATYQKAIEENPYWKEYRWKIARHYERLEDREGALATYRAIWEDTANPRAAYKLGIGAKRVSNYTQALKYFGAALEKVGNDNTLGFYVRLNAAQSHYALTHPVEALAHAKIAKKYAEEIQLSEKTQASLKRVFCLAAISNKEDDAKYCKFSPKTESAGFINLIEMKRALAQKNNTTAAKFATRIYENDAEEVDEGEAETAIPAYAYSDLPLAIEVLFQTENYRNVLELTDKFEEKLTYYADLHTWRAISHFALKEYPLAVLEFNKIKKLSPVQMNLHLMSLAHTGNWAEVKSKGALYMKDTRAREKLEKNFRTLKLYAPLREEADFEIWLRGVSVDN